MSEVPLTRLVLGNVPLLAASEKRTAFRNNKWYLTETYCNPFLAHVDQDMQHSKDNPQKMRALATLALCFSCSAHPILILQKSNLQGTLSESPYKEEKKRRRTRAKPRPFFFLARSYLTK